MIKEAIQYIVGLGNTRIEKVGEQVYSTQQLHKVSLPTPATIELRSLSGLVEYLQSGFDGEEQLMIHIESPTRVSVFSSFNRDFNRKALIQSDALIPGYSFERWYDAEEFNIKLQSVFVPNEDRDIMLKVVGNIKEEDVRTVGDNGVSQSVTAKVGVATIGQVEVPNPVALMPYRTFVEVEQPESDFIFRMQNGPRCALFEADGGAWKVQAMRNIKDYLHAALEEELTDGKLVIIA
ncbi:hypothetical protein FZC84_12010 [Rossellomorea vietnamensis]|uniref:Uncharacterized protein n=1 Tax=Rossellomorea vietnamensis TaxID=218284 RepID=A0A5D4MCP1_9BACI|nr:hypothetical protein [Rossellomorea vietnamensis]TYR99093.1 hypothetical protein FZC84_12010 [Rossellomorea vietnamensis]